MIPRSCVCCVVVAVLVPDCVPAQAQPAGATPGVYAVESSAQEPFVAAMKFMQADDPKGAAARLAPLAEFGEPKAMFALALLHDLGAGVRLDHEHARTLLERAVARGFGPAIQYLAWKYKVGFGVEEEPAAEKVELITGRAEKIPFGSSDIPSTWLDPRDGQPIPNFGRAFGWMLKAAGEGDVTAMSNLAVVLYGGPWVRANPIGHVTWLRKAAEAGDGPSAQRLSLYHSMGILVAKDEAQAAHWLRRAAEAGVVDAQYSLARDFARGRGGLPVDRKESALWYERAAAQGHVPSMLAFGRLLRDGESVPQDYARACKLFQAAADSGDADGYAELGWMIEKGRGTPRNLSKARDAYRKALELGDDWAGRALGDILRQPELGPTRWDEVLAAYALGAERGSESAMNALGDLHYEGESGPANREEAFLWYERAAREGNGWAQNRVGWMLRQGEGIERDDEEAVSWFRLAAKQGDSTAKANLGYHLTHGLGVERDAVLAGENLVASLKERESGWAAGILQTLVRTASPAEAIALRPVLDPILAEDGTLNPFFARLARSILFEAAEGLRDPEAARVRLEQRAERGDIDALTEACRRTFAGNGLPYDLTAARSWARRMAERDRVMGTIYEATIDIATGDAAARSAAGATLDAIASRGGGFANQTFGYICATGEGLPVDFDRAWVCVEVLAGLGMSRARKALELKATDPQEGLRRCFGAVAAPMPDPLVMAGLVAQRNSLQTLPDSKATPVHQVEPVYPEVLKSAGIEGRVLAEFFVGIEGRTVDVRCVEATHPLFAVATETAIQRWWYSPAREGGKPVRSKVRQVLAFTLGKDSDTQKAEDP